MLILFFQRTVLKSEVLSMQGEPTEEDPVEFFTKKYKFSCSHFAKYIINKMIAESDFFMYEKERFMSLLQKKIEQNISDLKLSSVYTDKPFFDLVEGVCRSQRAQRGDFSLIQHR